MSGLSLDTSSLENAAVFVERETGRDCATSLNKAALSAIIGSGSRPGAMQLTPKANRGVIAGIPTKKLTGFVIKREKRRGNWPLKSSEIQRLVKKERARRNRAVGYAAYAGYSNAAKAFGGRGVKGVTKEFTRSEAARGAGSKATPAEMTAEFTNTAPAAERIGHEALQQGIENAAADLIEYAEKKMAKTFAKVNA